jgi:hypothetical protein
VSWGRRRTSPGWRGGAVLGTPPQLAGTERRPASSGRRCSSPGWRGGAVIGTPPQLAGTERRPPSSGCRRRATVLWPPSSGHRPQASVGCGSRLRERKG